MNRGDIAAEPPGPLYGQELELRLLLSCHALLPNKRVVDVGAEKGNFVKEFLRAGCAELYAFEPYPPYAEHLRGAFGSSPAVHLFDVALGARDETRLLYIAEDASGRVCDSYHSLVPSGDARATRWREAISVECRSLGSLVQDGTLPAEIGILKIDTEGNDYDVLLGMGQLSSAVIMVECWEGFLDAVGTCRHPLSEMAAVLRERGYSTFAFVKRHDEFQMLQLNSTAARPGDWGNALFVHDRFFPILAPVIYEGLVEVQFALVDQGLAFRGECDARLRVIEGLQRECEARLRVIEGLQRECEARQDVINELRSSLRRGVTLPQRLGRAVLDTFRGRRT